jgi:hypothetical protein
MADRDGVISAPPLPRAKLQVRHATRDVTLEWKTSNEVLLC